MTRLTLERGVSLAVLASARTEAAHHEDLGCSIQGPSSRAVRRALAPLKRAVQSLGPEAATAQAVTLIRALEATPRYRALCRERTRRLGRSVLRPEVLFPDAKRQCPTVLHLRREELGLDVPVRAAEWPRVLDFFQALARGETLAALRRHRAPAGLLEELQGAGWLVPWEAAVKAPAYGALFIGHNTVLVSGGRARVLVDPYFRPQSVLDVPTYLPLQPRDVGPVDAVVVTHSHGDHFHLGSLLALGRETPIFVPFVARESLFSTDCALRLRQLGFTRAEPLKWGESRQVGDVRIEAHPFFGEQPTDGEGVHPGLVNAGNTWRLSTPRFAAAFYADAGHDARGDMRTVSSRLEPVDVLFCGIRGFRLRPILFGLTTLEAFLVDVPLAALTHPQQLMAGPEEAMDFAARMDARLVVPCADGGAPWYWREGMGPPYPGYPGASAAGVSLAAENPDADPFPERLLEVRAGPSRPFILRPGEALTLDRNATPRRTRFPGHTWPFAPL